MKVKPNPFIITFDDEADGGPAHLLYLLKDFVCAFHKGRKIVAEGAVIDVNHQDETVIVAEWNPISGLHDGQRISLNIYGDFDEVRYL
jgi:hypothetical protein